VGGRHNNAIASSRLSLQAPSSWLLLLLVIAFCVLSPHDVFSLSLSLSLFSLNPKPFSANLSLLAKLES
jgi:hypothetical protein